MNLFVLDIYFILTCLSLMSFADVNSQLWKTKEERNKETMCQWKMNQCILNQSTCTPNENKITLYVSTEFFERAVKSASSYSKILRSSPVFKKTLNQLSPSASVSGSYGGFSASASALYQSLSDSVSSTENYKETIQYEKTEFNTGFLQIIRETTTTVTINGISASVSESKFVDSVPTGESQSASQLHQRAEDYMELTFGQNRTVRNIFEETICQEKTPKDHYVELPNGPKCEDRGLKSVTLAKCQDVASSMNYVGTVMTGSWSWAPFGCLAGFVDGGWNYLYYNTQSGQTGRSIYRTFCNRGPDHYVELPNGPKCEDHGLKSVTLAKCQYVASSMNYEGTVNTGSWSWAPFGCLAGFVDGGWNYLYYNTQSGQTGRSIYKTFCNRGP